MVQRWQHWAKYGAALEFHNFKQPIALFQAWIIFRAKNIFFLGTWSVFSALKLKLIIHSLLKKRKIILALLVEVFSSSPLLLHHNGNLNQWKLLLPSLNYFSEMKRCSALNLINIANKTSKNKVGNPYFNHENPLQKMKFQYH